MKYHLLTFNDDWADEHSVPALECMTEKEYQEWRERPSGKLNPNYEKALQAQKDYEAKDKAFWKMLKKKGYTRNGQANTDKIPRTDHETLALEKEYRRLKYPSEPIRVFSGMSANLGNGGDNFNESYNHLYLMKEFVEQGIVDVMEVSEDFYNTFKKANLNQLSLCNIFDKDIAMYIDDDDEDYDEDNEDYDDED